MQNVREYTTIKLIVNTSSEIVGVCSLMQKALVIQIMCNTTGNNYVQLLAKLNSAIARYLLDLKLVEFIL